MSIKNLLSVEFKVVLCFFLLTTFSTPVYALVNYNDHPDLAKAMQYDAETNGGNMNKADRGKAVHFYKRYLKDVNESFQKARVYCQLGAMHAVSFNEKKGEKRNLKKAREYYKKVIELEPNRIGRPTLVARNILTTLNHKPFYGWVKARTNFYNWLASIDDDSLKKNYLPLRPPGKKVNITRIIPDPNSETGYRIETSTRVEKREPEEAISDSKIIGIKNLISSLKESSVYNATYDAKAMDNPHKGFKYILEHLPSDAPERAIVQDVIKKIADPSINRDLKMLLDTFHVPKNEDTNKPDEKNIIKKRVIYNLNYANRNNLPFVFDLKSGELVEKKMVERLDTKTSYKSLLDLGKGDIAWNGNLITVRDANLYGITADPKNKLKIEKGQYTDTYILQDGFILPYTLFARNKEEMYYRVSIIETKPRYIVVLYQQTGKSKAMLYKHKKPN